MNKNDKKILQDEFFKAVELYNRACRVGALREDSTKAVIYRTEAELLQRLLEKLCGKTFDIKLTIVQEVK